MRGKVAEKRERCTNVMSAKSYSARGIGAHTIFGSSILIRRPMKLCLVRDDRYPNNRSHFSQANLSLL